MVSSKFVLHSVKNGAIRTIYRRSCENCIESSAGVLRLAWTPVNLLSLNSFKLVFICSFLGDGAVGSQRPRYNV